MGARAELHGGDPGSPHSQPVLFCLYVEEPGGGWPRSVTGPLRRKKKSSSASWSTGSPRDPSCRSSMLQCRRVGTSWWKRSGTSICTELVVEVPKITSSPRRSRRRRVPLVQTAEQFVEVPTIVSYSSMHGLVEQNADIPVPHGCGGGGGLQGLRPRTEFSCFLLALAWCFG